MAIGVFDSGVGGLTVHRELTRRFPTRDFIYLADQANAPYGGRGGEEIVDLTRAGCERLFQAGASVVVLACNTASAACLRDARERYAPIPVIEVVLPAVRRAVVATKTGRIGVLGTEATISSRAYQDSFAAARDAVITAVPCPRFVDFVERGITSGRQILGLAQGYLEPLQQALADALHARRAAVEALHHLLDGQRARVVHVPQPRRQRLPPLGHDAVAGDEAGRLGEGLRLVPGRAQEQHGQEGRQRAAGQRRAVHPGLPYSAVARRPTKLPMLSAVAVSLAADFASGSTS